MDTDQELAKVQSDIQEFKVYEAFGESAPQFILQACAILHDNGLSYFRRIGHRKWGCSCFWSSDYPLWSFEFGWVLWSRNFSYCSSYQNKWDFYPRSIYGSYSHLYWWGIYGNLAVDHASYLWFNARCSFRSLERRRRLWNFKHWSCITWSSTQFLCWVLEEWGY